MNKVSLENLEVPGASYYYMKLGTISDLPILSTISDGPKIEEEMKRKQFAFFLKGKLLKKVKLQKYSSLLCKLDSCDN